MMSGMLSKSCMIDNLASHIEVDSQLKPKEKSYAYEVSVWRRYFHFLFP